jgi:hypothetical protein
MQRTVKRPLALFLATALILTVMPFAFAQAHGDEDHSADAPKHEKSVAELEQMLVLLKQLVALLQQQKALGGTVTINTKVVSSVSTGGQTANGEDGHDGHDGEDGEDGAHDGHDGQSGADGHDGEDAKTFAIEVEEHNGKTHVHIRYVDADIDDEDDLIEDIHDETGLPKSVIEPAIVYL